MARSGNEITVFRGNDRTIEVTVTDSAGGAYNLTGATIYFNVKKDEDDVASVIAKSTADVAEIKILSPATNGVFEIYLVPADSATISGLYVYDITLVIGGKTFTLVKESIDFVLPVK
jgi:hypothetical protein